MAIAFFENSASMIEFIDFFRDFWCQVLKDRPKMAQIPPWFNKETPNLKKFSMAVEVWHFLVASGQQNVILKIFRKI